MALAAGIAFLAVPDARLLLLRGGRSTFVLVAAAVAALLSGAYVAFYLRGGPRIIDATSYWLEARALSEGHTAWTVAEPSASFAGRFLVRDAALGGDHLAVIFPPGYPALLSLGFLAGAPMAVGPALAFALTYATAFLAESALPSSISKTQRETALRVAVALSVVCATARYHTADTMSHGLAACLAACAVGCALRLRSAKRAWIFAAGAGASVGWLVCTRPISGIAIGVACGAALLLSDPDATRASTEEWSLRAGAAVVAALPGVALLIAHQRAATGVAFQSAQTAYYAAADGPPGCFQYGFGDKVGCSYEHGDFVEKYMQGGYHFGQAVGTTGRRLAMHSADALNAGPLFLLVAAALLVGLVRPTRGPRALSIAVLLLVIAYVPFYFDGNYPGGGARFFADVLPFEHVLVAALVVTPPLELPRFLRDASRAGASCVGLALAGFSFFAHVDHEQLREREGGRPMFAARHLHDAKIAGGLVFLDTDHGFSLAYDPDKVASSSTIEAARLRGDALDSFLWEERGRPPAWHHHFDANSGAVSVTAYEPAVWDRVEGENLWPALEQRGATALPLASREACASAQRWLVVSPASPGTTTVQGAPGARLRLPRQLAGRSVTPVIVITPGTNAELAVFADGVEIERTKVSATPAGGCNELRPVSLPAGARRLDLDISFTRFANGAGLALDVLRF